MCNTIICSNVITTDTGVILVPNKEVKNLVNTGDYKLIIACNVDATANLPVFIQTALGNIPVLCCFSNTLYANQVKKRIMYRIGYGNENDNYELGQFTMHSRVSARSEITNTISL